MESHHVGCAGLDFVFLRLVLGRLKGACNRFAAGAALSAFGAGFGLAANAAARPSSSSESSAPPAEAGLERVTGI